MPAEPVISPHEGEIIATGVTFEEYLKRFEGMHCELVNGNVIKMSPATLQHQNIFGYLFVLLGAYFDFRKNGRVITQPFTQRLPNVQPKREPDLMIVLEENYYRIQETFLDGPADVCIEIVSEESASRDYMTKLEEYQEGGVGEYWLFDPLRSVTLFYRLNANSVYEPQSLDAEGNYRSPLLPGLVIHVPTLWKVPLPGAGAIVRSVEAMLK